MNVNFELYKIFYEVATNESITRAADVLMISQPAVSQGIQNLENSLNTTLFFDKNTNVIQNNVLQIYVYFFYRKYTNLLYYLLFLLYLYIFFLLLYLIYFDYFFLDYIAY